MFSFTAPIGADSTDAGSVLSQLVDIRRLSLRYGERAALNDVSFTIARGEIFGLLRPNGGGKTTLFKLLSTLVPMQSGSAHILGHDLKGETTALRRSVGVVFQHP